MTTINTIIEISSIKEMLKYINALDAVLIFDLDNTLIMPKTSLGSDEWFCGLLNHALNHVSDKNLALSMTLAIYHEVQSIVRADIIEEQAVKIVNSLHDIGIPCIAVTARDECLRDATLRQLQEVGIKFTQDIVFCSGRNKGECLLENLDLSKTKNIVMVDDKFKHLSDVASVLTVHNINFCGLRYGFLDEKVENFQLQDTVSQLQGMKFLLTDRVHEHIDILFGGDINLLDSEVNQQLPFDKYLYLHDKDVTSSLESEPLVLRRSHSMFSLFAVDTISVVETNSVVDYNQIREI